MKCGTNFWVHGKPFGDHILLNKLARGRDQGDDGLPCEMLKVVGHKTCCAIEHYAGKEYKPVVCREFPEVGDECFFVKSPLTPEVWRVESSLCQD